ncbi:MAG: hypothetical protein AAGC63_11530 [Propionicimonas sp.]
MPTDHPGDAGPAPDDEGPDGPPADLLREVASTAAHVNDLLERAKLAAAVDDQVNTEDLLRLTATDNGPRPDDGDQPEGLEDVLWYGDDDEEGTVR